MSLDLVKKIDVKIEDISEKFSDYTNTKGSEYTSIRKLGELPKVQITKEDHGAFTMYSYTITIKETSLGSDDGEFYAGGFNIFKNMEISKDMTEKIKDLDVALGRVLQYGK